VNIIKNNNPLQGNFNPQGLPQWSGGQQVPPQAQPVPQQAPQQAQPVPQQAPQGLLGRIGSGLKQMTSSPDFYDRMAVGLGGMTTNPNVGLIKMSQDRIAQRQKMGASNATAQAVIVQLMKMGKHEAAAIVRAVPAMAQEVLNEVMLNERKGASPTASPVQIDEDTGQKYQVVFDSDTMTNVRVDVEGAFGQTSAEKTQQANQTQLDLSDMEEAREAGVRTYDELKSLRKNTNGLMEARELVASGRASVGLFSDKIPAFTQETARLRQVVSVMGINVINSATFGALSERELDLALSLDINMGLPKDELLKLLDDKIAAQEKLYKEVGYMAERLNSGSIKYSDFAKENIQNQRLFDARNVTRKKLDVKDKVWKEMTKKERSAFD